MTTNIDLIKMAEKYGIKVDYILFKDELKLIPYKPNLDIILNMSNTKHPGTHWIALHTFKDMLVYFDSFGVEPPEEVIDFLRKDFSKGKLVYNNYQIQHITSERCGQHSLGFLGLMQGIDVPLLNLDR